MINKGRFEKVFERPKPIIGMIHLLPMPGTPFYKGSMNEIVDRALSDARLLEEGYVDGILVQNRGDLAYTNDASEPIIVSAVTYVVSIIMREISIPIGIHLLRNDIIGSMAISKVCGAKFVRLAVPIGASYLPQGIIEGKPSQTLRERARLQSEDLILLTDIDSFHYNPLIPTPIEQLISNILELRLADAFLVASENVRDVVMRVEQIKKIDPELKVMIGGFANETNLIDLISKADGAIIGAAFEEKGRNTSVSREKVLRIMEKVHVFRKSL